MLYLPEAATAVELPSSSLRSDVSAACVLYYVLYVWCRGRDEKLQLDGADCGVLRERERERERDERERLVGKQLT